MQINSIFSAFEGEGFEVGTPKAFIRTQSCSIGCQFCDTPEAQNIQGGKEMSVEEIYKEVLKYSYNHITLTGGEPLEQKHEEIVDLIVFLKERGYKITLETSGVYYNHLIFSMVDFISADIKTPSSGIKSIEAIKIFENFGHKSQFKCVVENWEDYNYIKQFKRIIDAGRFIITPCWKIKDKQPNWIFIKQLLERIKKEGLNIRVIIQQHKMIYGHERGV